MSISKIIPYTQQLDGDPDMMEEKAKDFFTMIKSRRTIRNFSDKLAPKKVIEYCIQSAGSAPSGANLQPWHFAAVSDPEIKSRIRSGAEKEEREFYRDRAPKEWLQALKPIGTDEHKPFLEKGPLLYQ